jgi:hypothetical protein
MARTLRKSLLIASVVVAVWATSSEACLRRRACAPAPSGCAGYGSASPTGYYGGGYAGGTAGYPGFAGGYGGYGGYPGPGGSMVGGYLRGRALGAMGAPAWSYGLMGGGVGGGSLMGAAAGYRAAGGR